MLYIIQMAITMPVGILFIIFGLLLAIKHKINLIHDYHYKNVKEQDIKAYTKLWGWYADLYVNRKQGTKEI